MDKYEPKNIEPKWQKIWQENGIYKNYSRPKKFYALDMFPYPSGAGLHVGHPKGYIATDVVSRYKMLQEYSVLHPMGWDAFGLPAENYAIKTNTHPRLAVEKNIKVFKKQLEMFGFTYDWDREISTTDPEYYKWTQWIFLKLFEKGLAYESEEPVNWCSSCKTVLANEDLENGLCERCGNQVVQKKLRQWVLKMTEYADRLLYDLDSQELDWEELIKEQQRNWIGRSEGAQFEMKLKDSSEKIEVYTTRLDTVFGMTYAVVAPEHPIIGKLKNKISNYAAVEKYIIQAQNKTNLERTDLQKEKTGIELEGVKVINPFNQEEIPLFVADYVLGFYGTGAVMAVPAHDERDFEFAKKYNLPIRQSVAPDYGNYNITIKTLEVLDEIFEVADKAGVKFWILGGLACAFYANIVYRKHDDIDMIAQDEENREKLAEILEQIGFQKIAEKKLTNKLSNFVYKRGDIELDLGPNEDEFGLADDFEEEVKNLGSYKARVLSKRFVKSFKKNQLETRSRDKDKIDYEYLNGKVFVDDGFLVDSEKYSGFSSQESRKKMTAWLEKEGIGQKKINYKMRDWVFSRQRYWGEPIPIVHCKKCGAVGVPKEQLPLTLPELSDYQPTETGEPPLAKATDWVNTKCPKCVGPAKRETNTMPQWAGSSWYYLRFIDPKNDKKLVDKKTEKDWMPVDLYVGGAEHATRHLLYARFWHKFLYDIGAVSTAEPFKKLVHVGLINGEDGRKMSKRWGNVINPDEVIAEFGADAMRIFEMFMGPFTQNINWSTAGVSGTKRFLDKVYKLQAKVGGQEKNKNHVLHKTIKKVTNDIENFHFNTAISQMMILVNELEKVEKIAVAEYEMLLIILSPFAPHLAEELWEKMGHKESIFLQKWPKYDAKLIKDEKIKLIVQVNGKVRDTIEAHSDISEDSANALALSSDKVKKFISGKQIKKTIFIKGRLINIVI